MRKTLKVLLVSMVLAGILATVLAVTVAAAGPQGKGNGTNTGQTGSSTIEVVSQLLGLTPEQIQQVSSFILTLVGTNPPNPKEPQGEKCES